MQESLVVPAGDILAATIEVLRREESLSTERGGFKGKSRSAVIDVH